MHSNHYRCVVNLEQIIWNVDEAARDSILVKRRRLDLVASRGSSSFVPWTGELLFFFSHGRLPRVMRVFCLYSRIPHRQPIVVSRRASTNLLGTSLVRTFVSRGDVPRTRSPQVVRFEDVSCRGCVNCFLMAEYVVEPVVTVQIVCHGPVLGILN